MGVDAQFVDRHDVGMVEHTGGLGFMQKHLHGFVAGFAGVNLFEGDLAAEGGLAGAVDGAHAAGAEFGEDFEGDGRTGCGAGAGRGGGGGGDLHARQGGGPQAGAVAGFDQDGGVGLEGLTRLRGLGGRAGLRIGSRAGDQGFLPVGFERLAQVNGGLGGGGGSGGGAGFIEVQAVIDVAAVTAQQRTAAFAGGQRQRGFAGRADHIF